MIRHASPRQKTKTGLLPSLFRPNDLTIFEPSKPETKSQNMKTACKTMVTLSKLSESMLKAPSSSELNKRKRNIVEFHPEELHDEFTPLKPEEADDCKLALFLDDHDFSFLFESITARENQQENSSSFGNLADRAVACRDIRLLPPRRRRSTESNCWTPNPIIKQDVSFLFASTVRENQQCNSSSFGKLADTSGMQTHTSSFPSTSSKKHRIPLDTKPDNQAGYIARGNKRPRV
jgi:hypothetical protein